MFPCWFSDVYSPTTEPQTLSFLNSFYCFDASDNDDSDAEPHETYIDVDKSEYFLVPFYTILYLSMFFV